MRQQILKAGNAIYDYVKSPLGLAVIGGIAGSTTTSYFDRTKQAQDLIQAHVDNQQLGERCLKLQNVNSDLSSQIIKLSNINADYVKITGELRDELRHAAADIGIVKDHLNDCRKSSMNLSWFFSKSNEVKNQEVDLSSDNHSNNATLSK